MNATDVLHLRDLKYRIATLEAALSVAQDILKQVANTPTYNGFPTRNFTPMQLEVASKAVRDIELILAGPLGEP